MKKINKTQTKLTKLTKLVENNNETLTILTKPKTNHKICLESSEKQQQNTNKTCKTQKESQNMSCK